MIFGSWSTVHCSEFGLNIPTLDQEDLSKRSVKRRSEAAIDLKVCRAVFSAAEDDDDDRGFDYKPDRHSRSFVGWFSTEPTSDGQTARGANRLPNFMGSSIAGQPSLKTRLL